jgi:hypothetical protein
MFDADRAAQSGAGVLSKRMIVPSSQTEGGPNPSGPRPPLEVMAGAGFEPRAGVPADAPGLHRRVEDGSRGNDEGQPDGPPFVVG